jgi:hypothetical protein
MSNNFLVLGLPRSRTAWLANFLTYGDITCTHEGLNGCATLEDYKKQFRDSSGDSNTGLAFFEFEPLFTDFKKIIIDSGIRKSVEFAKKTYGRDSFDQIVRLKKRLDSIDGLHIPFDDIDHNLELIWDYVSRYQFNEERAAQLIRLNIQIRDPFSMDARASAELFKNTNHYL